MLQKNTLVRRFVGTGNGEVFVWIDLTVEFEILRSILGFVDLDSKNWL